MNDKYQKQSSIDRRTFLKLSGAAGLGLAVSSLGVPAFLHAAPETIKIGSIQPVTGPLAVIGQGTRLGNQVAVDLINAAGGIKSMGGAKLELLLGDSESKPEVGRQEADRLIKEGASILVGAFQSDVSMAIATLAEQRQVPIVLDIAALDDITQKGYEHVFRVFITSGGLVSGAIKYLKALIQTTGISPKTAVLANVADSFGKGMSDGFLKMFESSGLDIKIVERIQYPLGIQDLSAEVAKIKAAKPDILFPISRPGDSVILLRELFKQRIPLMGIYGPGSPGWYEPEFVKDMDKLALHTMINVPWVNPTSPTYQKANAAFLKACGKNLDTNTAYAYTGVQVIADVLERAGSTKREALLKALKETNLKDHPVVGGPIKFNEKGDNTGALTALVQIQPDADPLKRPKIVMPKEFSESDKIVFPAPQLWER